MFRAHPSSYLIDYILESRYLTTCILANLIHENAIFLVKFDAKRIVSDGQLSKACWCLKAWWCPIHLSVSLYKMVFYIFY